MFVDLDNWCDVLFVMLVVELVDGFVVLYLLMWFDVCVKCVLIEWMLVLCVCWLVMFVDGVYVLLWVCGLFV